MAGCQKFTVELYNLTCLSRSQMLKLSELLIKFVDSEPDSPDYSDMEELRLIINSKIYGDGV